MTQETQFTINEWQRETFGYPEPTIAVARLNEEMAELLMAVALGDMGKIRGEVADVYVVLCQLADRVGVDIARAVDDKMAINRARSWGKTSSGVSYHDDRSKRDYGMVMIRIADEVERYLSSVSSPISSLALAQHIMVRNPELANTTQVITKRYLPWVIASGCPASRHYDASTKRWKYVPKLVDEPNFFADEGSEI